MVGRKRGGRGGVKGAKGVGKEIAWRLKKAPRRGCPAVIALSSFDFELLQRISSRRESV